MTDDILLAAFTPDRKGAVVSVRFSDLWRKANVDRQMRIITSLLDMLQREHDRLAEEQAKLAHDQDDKI
jgi:hypothetical protein